MSAAERLPFPGTPRDGGRAPGGPPLAGGGELRLRAQRLLAELDREAGRLLPGWKSRSAEDPLWVLLECFALRLAVVEASAEALPSRLLSLLKETLSTRSAWPLPLRTVVRLSPESGVRHAVRVPAGTRVTRSRAGGDPWRWSFETAHEGWASTARLRRAVVCEGSRTEDLPIDEDPERKRADAGRGGGAALFTAAGLDRYLYLGDAGFLGLREGGDVVLEWPNASREVVDGDWEYSAGAGWRALQVDLMEIALPGGGRALRVRARGPLADLVERRVEGVELPWLRLGLAAGMARFSREVPSIAWLRVGAPRGATGTPSVPGGLPRPVSRILATLWGRTRDQGVCAGGRLDDVRAEDDDAPAVYLGLDQPLPSSLFIAAAPPARPDGFPPPRFVWERSTPDGFEPCAVADGTTSLTTSGTLSWGLERAWAARRLFGERLFWIRGRWIAGSYFAPPRIYRFIPSSVEVIEGARLVDWPLRVRAWNGAIVEVEPSWDGELAGIEVVEALEPGAAPRTLRRTGHAQPAAGEFAARRLLDGGLELTLDAAPTARAVLHAPALRAGLRPGGASHLRLPAGTRFALELEDSASVRVEQLLEVWGGANGGGASVEDGMDGDPEPSRAVSAEDYRRLVRRLVPTAGRVDVVPSPEMSGELFVVLVPGPESSAARVSPAGCRWIEESLQARVPLGTWVRVVEAALIPWRVTVTAAVAGRGRVVDALRGLIEERVRAYLDPLAGGDGRASLLGKNLQPEGLIALISGLLGGEGEDPPLCSVDVQVESDVSSGQPLPWSLPVLGTLTVVVASGMTREAGA